MGPRFDSDFRSVQTCFTCSPYMFPLDFLNTSPKHPGWCIKLHQVIMSVCMWGHGAMWWTGVPFRVYFYLTLTIQDWGLSGRFLTNHAEGPGSIPSHWMQSCCGEQGNIINRGTLTHHIYFLLCKNQNWISEVIRMLALALATVYDHFLCL